MSSEQPENLYDIFARNGLPAEVIQEIYSHTLKEGSVHYVVAKMKSSRYAGIHVKMGLAGNKSSLQQWKRDLKKHWGAEFRKEFHHRCLTKPYQLLSDNSSWPEIDAANDLVVYDLRKIISYGYWPSEIENSPMSRTNLKTQVRIFGMRWEGNIFPCTHAYSPTPLRICKLNCPKLLMNYIRLWNSVRECWFLISVRRCDLLVPPRYADETLPADLLPGHGTVQGLVRYCQDIRMEIPTPGSKPLAKFEDAERAWYELPYNEAEKWMKVMGPWDMASELTRLSKDSHRFKHIKFGVLISSYVK